MRAPAIKLKKRILALLIIFFILLLGLTTRLVWVQIVLGEHLSEEAVQTRTRSISIHPKRGHIRDVEGRDLAVSLGADSLYAVPAEIPNVFEVAEALAPILDRDTGELRRLLSEPTTFLWLERKLDPKISERIRRLDLPGLYFTQESKRYYPKGSLGSHILGFAGIDNQGLEGIEAYFDEILRGKDGELILEVDAGEREIPQAVHHRVPAKSGDHVYLTIDEVLQHIAERELTRAVAEHEAKGGFILLMEPATGRLLAMANYPAYDLNEWTEVPSSRWRNPLICDTIHPGSVFKSITAAAAIEEEVVSPSSEFNDTGIVQVPGATIRNWDLRGLGETDFSEGFRRSANTVFAKVAAELGLSSFYQYLRNFGFDGITGIELPGETDTMFPPEEDARPVDLAVMSYGQTLSTTPIQMLMAGNAAVNGGELLRPQIVSKIESTEDGSITEVAPESIGRVISAETSATVRQLMVKTVTEGPALKAQIPGYQVGGKTGTAQKTIDGRVSTDHHMAAFLGFAGGDIPALLGYVVIDEPKGSIFGSEVAAPVFQSVVADALRYLDVPPDDPEALEDEADQDDEASPELSRVQVPKVTGLSLSDAAKQLEEVGLRAEPVGTVSNVGEQFPQAGTEIEEGRTVLLHPDPDTTIMTGDAASGIPDLSGKTLRQALEILSDMQLRVEIKGSGLVRDQDPAPGAPAILGGRITIFLESPD